MTPTVVDQARQSHRTRDWAEIQERMLVPLYEAAYDRLEVSTGTRLLGLGCGSGLALLVAATRGASVTGVEDDEARLLLARERLLPAPDQQDAPRWDARLVRGRLDEPVGPDGARRPPNVVTAFHTLPDAESLSRTAAGLTRGTPVVLAGWGPAERCAAAGALRVAARSAGSAGPAGPAGSAGPAQETPSAREAPSVREAASAPEAAVGGWAPGGRDDLEELALRSGLRLDGSGRVACPFGYADLGSAARGLLSTGLYDAAVRETDEEQVLKELAEAVHPYVRADGTVWMPNLFRYVIARTD